MFIHCECDALTLSLVTELAGGSLSIERQLNWQQ